MGDRVAMASRLGLVLALLAACYAAGSQAATAPATPKSCCRCQKVLNSNKQEFCHKVPHKDEDKCLNEFDDMFLNCKTLLGYDAKPVPPKESNETVKRAVWVPMSGICAAAECDCAQSMNDCAENAKCTTNNAGQSCSCNAGYVGDGHVCRSLGSCDACSPYSTCEELTDDRVQCTCNRGYDGDGVSCTGNGNCDLNNGGCDPSATCRKTSSGPTAPVTVVAQAVARRALQSYACLSSIHAMKTPIVKMVAVSQIAHAQRATSGMDSTVPSSRPCPVLRQFSSSAFPTDRFPLVL